MAKEVVLADPIFLGGLEILLAQNCLLVLPLLTHYHFSKLKEVLVLESLPLLL